jgi:hypothetical protein
MKYLKAFRYGISFRFYSFHHSKVSEEVSGSYIRNDDEIKTAHQNSLK